jgi:hypothetical protein
MNAMSFTLPEHVEARIQRDLERGLLHALEGTLQRVNYQRRELAVVSQCRVWHFTLAPDCQLWFDDKPTILRCFHALDQVKVIFEYAEAGNAIRAMYAWERR